MFFSLSLSILSFKQLLLGFQCGMDQYVAICESTSVLSEDAVPPCILGYIPTSPQALVLPVGGGGGWWW